MGYHFGANAVLSREVGALPFAYPGRVLILGKFYSK